MSPCSPTDISLNIPDPVDPNIINFNKPQALVTPKLTDMLDGFPENLMDLLDALEMNLPTGKLKSQLSPNYGKDEFDAILKLFDQFMPYLMLYKLFLPVLNLIICIIEVLCSLTNPFKLVRAMKKLFTQCIPAFLSLFPIFAFIVILISLFLLLLALIEYIILKIIALIKLIIKNIKMLKKSFEDGDEKSIMFILKKIGAVLCSFQNLMVLLSIFTIILNTIKEILAISFPPSICDDSDCCTPDVCPEIVKKEYTKSTAKLSYLNKVSVLQTLSIFPPPFNTVNFDVRNEVWQLYDNEQNIAEKFINISDAYDVAPDLKKVFFPTDVVYDSQTDPKQAAYTVDLELFYNPTIWNGVGVPRKILIKDCIVLRPPTTSLSKYDNSSEYIRNGVLLLSGGKVFEENGTPINNKNLNSFIHLPDKVVNGNIDPSLLLTPLDGYEFVDVKYTFKPNIPVLLNKNLVTLGCDQTLALDKAFVNNIFASDLALKTQLINNISFPDTQGAQDCLMAAISAFRANISEEGAAEFQAVATLCLTNLKDQTISALNDLIRIGYDPCKSEFSGQPNIQFTTKPIKISLSLKDRNGILLTSKIPDTVAQSIAKDIKAYPTFGSVGSFNYDGYGAFLADLISPKAGSGQLLISFNDNTLCKTYLPTNIDESPVFDLQKFDYEFIYGGSTVVAEGDMSDGFAPRRDLSDN